jgi:hypothetical protein
MNLRNQEFLDLNDPPQRLRGFEVAIVFHQRNGRVNLMKNLLEPKFVSLVYGDEEQFVVLRW